MEELRSIQTLYKMLWISSSQFKTNILFFRISYLLYIIRISDSRAVEFIDRWKNMNKHMKCIQQICVFGVSLSLVNSEMDCIECGENGEQCWLFYLDSLAGKQQLFVPCQLHLEKESSVGRGTRQKGVLYLVSQCGQRHVICIKSRRIFLP